MASEELQEKIEEKEESNEAIDLKTIHNPSTSENKKGQMEIKSDVLDGNSVNKEGDLVKQDTEIPSKLGIFVEPNQIITEKPESLEKCTLNLEGELKEQEVLRHEEVPSPLEEPTAQEQQEKVNGETENKLYSTQFTEQLLPELVLKGDGIPPNGTSIISEEVQEKIDTEEVTKEDAHQNQISEKDKTEEDAIQCNSIAALSEKDYQKEVELPIENASQHPEEDIAKEVGTPSSKTPLVAEEVLEKAKGETDVLEEVQNEQIHQFETAKENMAEERECPDEAEDQSRDVSVVVTSEETTPEEASQENKTPEMICKQVKQTEDPTSYDQPITIQETRKSDEGSEHMSEEVGGNDVPSTTTLISKKAEENDVPATTTLISEEAEESADIKEDSKEEAHQDQIFREDETDKDASQSTSVVYLPERYCENETKKTIENASENPEEVEEVTKEVDLKEGQSPSSMTSPVSEEVLEEAKENISAVEEVQNEQAAEEKECNSTEAKVQNRDVSEVVVSEETMPEAASSEKETPEMISEEAKSSEDTIAMAEKDETRKNDNEENAAHKDLTSSHQTITNEEICQTDEGSEHISEKSTLETVTTRDITPEIEIKDAETEALTSETDNRDIEEMENQDEAKSPEDVKPSESVDAPIKIEEETLNDFEEEKLEGDNKWKHKEIDDEQEVKSSFPTEEQLDKSKAPPSEEEVSAERDIIETKPTKETEGGEQNVAQNDITLDSKETFSNDEEVVNYDEKAGEAMEMHIPEEHNANNGINGDELGEGKGIDDEADNRNVEEISEPAEPISNTEASKDAEIPREKIELQSDNVVSAHIIEGEEALQETPCESTALSNKEGENTGYKVLDSETDNMVVENSQEDSNELPDKADKDASASEDQIEEDGKVNINEHDEVEQKLGVEDETEENLFDNVEHETAPSIQNEENLSERDDNIKNEIINESSEVESSSEVTEAPEEDVQNITSERSYKQDQLVPEKATEQDGLKISSSDNEFETEKLEIGDAPSHGEEKTSAILQNDDELDLKLKPEENIEAETLSNEEITQRVEEVEEPCITHNKEELPEAQSTIECKETSNEPSISTNQDQQSQESGAKPTEANQSTDDTSVEEGSEVNTTLISSSQQIDERSISQDEGDKMQEDNIVVGTPKEETEGEPIEKQTEEIPQITNPREVPEVDLGQSETVSPETENLEVVSDEKLGDESKSTDKDSKLEELENTTSKLTEQQKSSEVDATLSASEEQIGEGSVAKEESVILQEEDLKMPKEDSETIEAANEEHIEEEIPQITNPREVPEVDLSQSETVSPETENLEVVSDEKLGDESKSTDTDSKLEELENTTNELTELQESSIEPSNTREVQIDQTEIIAKQNQLSQESDVKLTEPERATDKVSAQKNSEVDTTLSASEEQIGEGSIAQEESVILQEEELKMPKEDAEMIEAANEEHIEEEIPQTVQPSEITEEQLVESETVGPEAEHLEIVLNEKSGDENKLMETDLIQRSQMESTPDELIEEKLNANLSSSERSEESEVLLQNTGGRVEGEKTDAEMPKEEICQAIEAAEEPCDKHIEGEILKTADSENAAEELKSIFGKEVDHQKFETQTESPEQENEIEESASVEEKSDATAISVPSEGQIEEKENAINESGVVPQSTTESVIVPEEKLSEGVETNDEPSDKFIAGEISQIVPTSEITEKQLGESEIEGLDAKHLENVSNEKFGDESKLSETVLTSDQMENTLDKLIREKSNANLSACVEQTSERLEESEGLLQNTGEQVQRDKTDDEMPKEEICQALETVEEPCDKHIEGEICRTPDPEIFGAAEESKAVLTEKEVDPQKFGTGTESPELEKVTEEFVSVEERSDATAIFVPGEGQIEEVEIANKESSGAPQNTTESMIVSEEKISQSVETNDEPSDQDISGESSKIVNPEIHDMAVQSKIMSNDEEVDSKEHGTEIELTELEKATEESTSIEEKSDAGADLVPNEGKIKEIEIENKESSVAPQNTVELVTVPEEKVSQEIQTNEEPSDKHVVGELREKDISIDNFEASEEIHLVLEDKVDQGQTTASPVEQPDSKNVGTEMKSAFLEKTNGNIDVKANLEKTTMTSFVEEEGSVINQTDNGSEIVPVVEQTHEEKTKLIDEKIVPEETANSTETEELQVQEEALDTVVTEFENQTRDEDLIKIEPREEISEIEKVGQEKDIPTEFLKTAEQKVAVDETNEDTEETVPNFSEQNKDVEEVPNQSEGPEDRDFASIVSSFLISKVLSEENPRTDGGAKQNNDASFIPKALDEENIPEITTNKQEPETTDEEILYSTSLREEEKPEIQELVEEHKEKKVEEDGEGDGVEQDYLPVSRFLMDKILRQEENKNPGEEKVIEGTDKQLVGDDGIRVEEKIEENSNTVMAPEQKGETPSSFAEVARDIEKEETLTQKVDDTFVGDGGISIEEKTEETSSVVALPMREGEGSRSSLEVARDFEEAKPADDTPKPVEDKNKTMVSDVGILSVEKNGEGKRSVVVVPEQEGEKSISPIEAVRDFEKKDKSIEQKNEALVTNEGISIIEKIEDNTGEVAIPKQGQKTLYPADMVRDFDEDAKPAEIKDESLVSVDGACTVKRIEENNKVALHEQEGETEPSLVEEVEDLVNREQNKDLVNPHEFLEPEKIIGESKSAVMHKEEEHKNEVIADEETLKDVRDEENYVLVEHQVNQFEESKEILMMVSDATIPNLEKKQDNLSAEIQDAERNLVQQAEISENDMKNSPVSCKEIEERLPDIPKLPTTVVKTEEILQEPLEKQRDLEATEIRKELVGNESDYTRGEEQVKEVTGTVVESIKNKNQELTEIEAATKIEKKSEEIKDEGYKKEEKEEEEKHQDETEIISRDLTINAEARETEMKSAPKKSHNILSGVGSKVKHSLAKVKKAITGKSKNSPSAK